MPIIKALNVYPIKSCKALQLTSAVLTSAGILYDREWMVVKDDTGRFVSQREKSELALVEVSIPAEALVGDWGKLAPDAALSVTAPGMPLLKVQLTPRPDGDAPVRKSTVWEWTGAGLDQGDDAAQWFSKYLGFPVRLVRYIGSGSAAAAQKAAEGLGLPLVRKTEEEFAVNYEVRFSDGFPVLLANEASLADLNTKLPEPIAMTRFRPNIVVAGMEAWEEDSWRAVDVLSQAGGAVRLLAVKPCSRCTVTTIEQTTGVSGGDEPLDTLRTFRSGKVLGWSEGRKSWTHAVFFAWNCVSRDVGILNVGDAISTALPQQVVTMVPAC